MQHSAGKLPKQAPVTIEQVVLSDTLAKLALDEGGEPRAVRAALLRSWGWGRTRHLAIRKMENDGDGPGSGAGAHGIPEIANAEQAFYDTLTTDGKAALRELQKLVERLYEEHRGWGEIEPHQIDEPIDAWKTNALRYLARHPLQAYLLGQALASEAVNARVHRPITPQDQRAIQYLTQYTFNEISDNFESLKHDLRTELIDGIANGRNPREVGRRLANRFNDYTTWWDTIATTETARAETQGRLQEYVDQGLEYVIGSSAHDPRTCDWCKEHVDGQKIKISDIINRSNFGVKRADWLPVPPVHPRCRCVLLPG